MPKSVESASHLMPATESRAKKERPESNLAIIDNAANKLKKVTETEERKRGEQELFDLLKPRIAWVLFERFPSIYVGLFARRPDLISKWQRDSKEMYGAAYEEMVRALANWDVEGREARGEKTASFAYYFTFCFLNYLRSRWKKYHTTISRGGETGVKTRSASVYDGEKYEGEDNFPDARSTEIGSDLAELVSMEEVVKAAKEFVKQPTVDFKDAAVFVLRYRLGEDLLEEVLQRADEEERRRIWKKIKEGGYDLSQELTLKEVGEIFGYTKEGVRQIQKRMIRSLRENLDF